MGVQILVLSVAIAPPLFVESSARTITLGRGPESDVRLPDPSVSLVHASLRKRGKNYIVVADDSTNGTALVGRGGAEPVWLSPGAVRLVENGDRLLLGRVELEIRLDGSAEGLPSEDLAGDLVTASLAAIDHELSPEIVAGYLEELTEADDELVGPEKKRVSQPTPTAVDVIDEERAMRLTDFATLGISLALLLSAPGAFAWLFQH